MDGYSVSEAASVLGVPIERVWELLARGVLAGTPEGETGMRVFLQPRSASVPTPAPPPAENGGTTREPERELSPFRELLTEFRNLTERYGQALLALGESRGEVAALRSRVDLLEARMDLGLPPPGRVRPAGTWGSPSVGPDPSVIPSTTSADEADRDPQPDEHRARRRGPRRATESFAEALARAEDPSLPELPAAETAAEAETVHASPADEPALPRELPVADTVPVADEPAEPLPETVPVAEDLAEPLPEPEPGTAERTSEREPEPGPPEAVSADADAAPATEPGPVTWDTDRYTADIDEPDWYEAEADEPPPPPPADEAEPEVSEETLMWLHGDDSSASPLPGSGELETALEGLEATPPAAAEEAPAPDNVDRPPSPSAIPPSALRYRPVTPTGPTGRAYRRLRRIFPE